MIDAKLPQFYTQWTVIDGLFDDPVRGPETVKMIRDAGKEVWSYNCARFMHKKGIRKYYRFYPWRCWLRGLDGVAMWTFFSPQGDGRESAPKNIEAIVKSDDQSKLDAWRLAVGRAIDSLAEAR